jgi:hypothetical protein
MDEERYKQYWTGNLKQWLLNEADGEEIEAVVIGLMGGQSYYEDRIGKDWPKGKMLSWEEAAPLLDYTFDDGIGGNGCHAVYAWTANKVIAIAKYDGSTWAFSIPSHPIDCMPELHGDG